MICWRTLTDTSPKQNKLGANQQIKKNLRIKSFQLLRTIHNHNNILQEFS